MHNLLDLVATYARTSPDAPALIDTVGAVLSYRNLANRLQQIASAIARSGAQSGDKIAIALPNGPESAIAFLAVSCVATAAPLNPAFRRDEFEFYLRDLGAKFVIADPNATPQIVEAADAVGIAVVPLPGSETSVADLDSTNFAKLDDVALVLHTSGTTSRPKIVPLTHANLLTSAQSVSESLGLREDDRCLNVMPLFHIHGLVAAVLASFVKGGSVVCTPGFNADRFKGWCKDFSPTWYTAVPTMHQAILATMEVSSTEAGLGSLRFARSCSSALPPRLMSDLEAALKIPVVEAYGMTEASHQMATNPLPPAARKPGSVGRASGVEVQIMNEAGEILPAGATAEIVIRGPSVTKGYESPAEANATAFTNGWFRTGDQGHIDGEGYLFITGRIKEMINRGGEKLSPREIDEALMEHDAVAQAVAFAVPHRSLGEDVAVAIVLKAGAQATVQELREFAFSRLADFKVPSSFAIVETIPKGPTGKLQRIGLAEKLGDLLKAPKVDPRDALEVVVAEIWADTLGLDSISIQENFFQSGGDSLLGARLINKINDLFGTKLGATTIFKHLTVEGFSKALKSACGPDQVDAVLKRLEAQGVFSNTKSQSQFECGEL